MRSVWITGLTAAMLAGGAADAQRVDTQRMDTRRMDTRRVVQRGPGAGYPVPGPAPRQGGYRPQPLPSRPAGSIRAGRWPMRDGRWNAGWNAPGGWNGYRRPYRGWALPGYWVQPAFVVDNWVSYGLARPPYGYNWTRYYDDAVLVDARGSVYDTVEGIDWDGGEQYDGGRYAGDDAGDRGRDDRRGDRLGGAAIGAVAGGVGGNVIAGRGNRLGGTLIGAGVGAAAGYAIDRAGDRDRRPPPRGYGAEYPPPAPAYAPPPGGEWRSPDGTTVVTTTAGGYHGGSATTTVVVQTAPVVTTTTTEIYEDAVAYSRPAVRKVARRRWRSTKTLCRCD